MKDRRALLAPPLLLCLALLPACGSESDAAASARSGSTGTSAVPSTGSDQGSAPVTTAEDEVTTAEDESKSPPASGDTEASAPTGTTSTPPPAPPWPPPEAPAVHGGQAWGVYLAVAPGPAPELDRALADVRSLGYEGAAVAQVGCDLGAAEALGVDPGHLAVVVHFATQGDAEYFVGRYMGPMVGYAQVTTFCLD